jgi:hypothetical protein
VTEEPGESLPGVAFRYDKYTCFISCMICHPMLCAKKSSYSIIMLLYEVCLARRCYTQYCGDMSSVCGPIWSYFLGGVLSELVLTVAFVLDKEKSAIYRYQKLRRCG